LDIFHEWITLDFRDKLSHGNQRVSGGGQVDRDRIGKMSSRKISGKWASAGTRLKRLQRTGGTGGIVSSNASLTRDEPGTRKGGKPLAWDVTAVCTVADSYVAATVREAGAAAERAAELKISQIFWFGG